jgi:pimeloyl-ACP methyl ester carboxylesterase
VDRIKIGHLEFKCASAGTAGPLLVLLHGFGGSPLDWHHVIPGLGAKHRVLVPNLMPLFSSVHPLTFSKQVEICAGLLNHVNSQREKFVLIGSSFGATLSWGLRANFQSLVTGQIMINPMPLEPLAHFKSNQLRMLFALNMVPGALPLFLKTGRGHDLLIELSAVFGFGDTRRAVAKGAARISERKLDIVTKAVQRFAWIAQQEDWAYWSKQLTDHVIPLLLITGSEDPLFSEKDFRSYQNIVPMSEHMPVDAANHMMVRTHGPLLAETIEKFVVSLDGEGGITAGTLRRAI